MRCFISINISKEVTKEIGNIQQKLPEFQGKKTELENLHLTLKFLGEIDEGKIDEIKKKLREIKFEKFESEIDSIGVFDNRKSRKYKKKVIVWLHLSGCSEFQKIVDEKLKDLFEKERRFMSHLTIARVKNIKDKKKFLDDLKKIKMPETKFNINSFYLMRSELTKKGPRYEIIEEYKLI